MKTFYAIVLLTFVGLAILGCSESTDQLVTPVEKASTVSLEKGIIHSATGSYLWKIDPLSGEKNTHLSFNAVLHSNGKVTGQLNGEGYIKANVYDLKVSGNIAKLSFNYVRGPLGNYYSPPVDISEIYGWLIVIDNGEGSNAIGPDSVSLIIFTDGSDIGNQTIAGIDAMSPEEYLLMIKDYLLPFYGFPYEDFFIQEFDNGSIQVR